MKRFLVPFLVLAAAAAVLAGCGGDDDSTDSSAANSETEAAAPAGYGSQAPAQAEDPSAGAGTSVKVADSEFGQILFDGSDQAIYLFDKERSAKSECYGECAAAWPPVLTDGDPQAGAGAEAGKLGTTERDDGSTQVTYNGHPLYYYVDDPKGEVLCHDVNEFGGLWLVVDPAGNAV
jgi:predicted lipoprotein with Yx(FWY)xxD motif